MDNLIPLIDRCLKALDGLTTECPAAIAYPGGETTHIDRSCPACHGTGRIPKYPELRAVLEWLEKEAKG